MHGETLKISHF